tara:strand:+ start:312 stop:875 length:564 start_codon:yes stop_codon:yes gene_type:complete
MKKIISLIILLTTINSITGQTRTINTKESTIKWFGKELSTKEHFGSLKFIKGEYTTLNDLIKSGEFIVDMTTLEVHDLEGIGKEKLEGHLKSNDFFSVETHKNAKLIILGSRFKNDSNNQINGELTIKGKTHPIKFLMEVKEKKAEAKLTFDRSIYDVRFRSGSFFENLGDKLIYDDIRLEINLIFN